MNSAHSLLKQTVMPPFPVVTSSASERSQPVRSEMDWIRNSGVRVEISPSNATGYPVKFPSMPIYSVTVCVCGVSAISDEEGSDSEEETGAEDSDTSEGGSEASGEELSETDGLDDAVLLSGLFWTCEQPETAAVITTSKINRYFFKT